MFTIAFRYILKRLIVTFFVVSPIVILIAWIAMSIKHIGMIVSDSVQLLTFLKLILCLSPWVCGIVFPICFLLSAIIAIHNLNTNKELTVLLCSGKSPLSIASPIVFWGSLISAIVMFLNIVGAPYAYKNFETMKEDIQTTVSINFLKIRSFNIIGHSVVYIGSREKNTLNNIFISYMPKKQNANVNIITARRGAIIRTNTKKIFIQLEKGCRQEIDKNDDVISTLMFDNLSYDITHLFKKFYKKSSKVNYKTQAELLQIARDDPDEKIKKNCLAEYHSRILISFASIINSLIVGIFLIIARERGRGRKDAVLAFSCGTICHIGLMVLLNMATKNIHLIFYNYIIVFAFILFLFLFFIKERN